MKTTLITICCILFLLSCKINTNKKSEISTSDLQSKGQFEIVKIDSIENTYIVYARRNDSIVKIVSAKETIPSCNSIKKGKFYALKLRSVFSPNFHQKLDIAGFKFNGTLIKIKGENTVWDLFITENMKGLCYEK